MKYSVSKNEGKQLYLQLYEQLKQDIVAGSYPYGRKLPSKRILAEELGISVIPVEHAYELLCDEGYVEARERSGYFVIYRQDNFLTASGTASVPLIMERKYLQRSSKGVFPYTVLAKLMRRVLLDYGENILVKSDNCGCLELRTAIAAYLARSSDIIARPEQIVIGSGAEYLYGLLAQLLGKQNIFALEDPSYEQIGKVYRANGLQCEMLKLHEDGIDSQQLFASQAKVLHVTPFNSFPSGISVSASKKYEYLNWAAKCNGCIIEDNYDSELTVSRKNEETLFAMAQTKNVPVIYLNTFSHTIAPSFRAGYMILPLQMVDDFKRKIGFYSCTVPVFEQYVLTELLESGEFERHINRLRRQRRKQLNA